VDPLDGALEQLRAVLQLEFLFDAGAMGLFAKYLTLLSSCMSIGQGVEKKK
jgi:hypothetical protein